MAALGRWSAVDPLADRYAGYSPYSYVLGNPTSFIDPDGMQVADLTAGSMEEYGANAKALTAAPIIEVGTVGSSGTRLSAAPVAGMVSAAQPPDWPGMFRSFMVPMAKLMAHIGDVDPDSQVLSQLDRPNTTFSTTRPFTDVDAFDDLKRRRNPVTRAPRIETTPSAGLGQVRANRGGFRLRQAIRTGSSTIFRAVIGPLVLAAEGYHWYEFTREIVDAAGGGE
jgi:hypothetical protein